MREYSIKQGYRPNLKPEYYEDAPTAGLVYQPDVYRLALYLAQRSGARYVLDVGCGSGDKLKPFLDSGIRVIGIDFGANAEKFKAAVPQARFFTKNLEEGLPRVTDDVTSEAVVVCSDVVEHLVEPHALLGALSALAGKVKYLCMSTPDRERARGIADCGPPANRAHVREWSLGEFHSLATEYGFNPAFLGRTVNTNWHQQKSNILLVDGREARFRPVPPKSVLAVINVFNEADMLPEVMGHLLGQGVHVHVLDNWSTDGSWEYAAEQAKKASGVVAERFPAAPTEQYEWSLQLRNVERVALAARYDWILHYDADELRQAPWAGCTLQQAISFVDALGYNAVDFTVIDYRFIAGQDVRSGYRDNLTHFEFGRRAGHMQQVKGWKRIDSVRVDLDGSGGHDVQFPGRKVFPLKFLNRHYALRNPSQAADKVFKHRKPRFQKERAALGRHVQYDRFNTPADIVWKPEDLVACSEHHFQAEYLVERLSGIGLFDSLPK